ncbi:MAG TPA: hypothetical protein VJB91_03475 [Patescibacteria group bacterium]|nr:hypothetical protein [Patescibacteria group bacterium]
MGSAERALKRETGIDVRKWQPRPPDGIVTKWLYQSRNGYKQEVQQSFQRRTDARSVTSCEFEGIEQSLAAGRGERGEIDCRIGVTLGNGQRGTIYDSTLGVDLLTGSVREIEEMLQTTIPALISEGLESGSIRVNESPEGIVFERR